MLKKLIFLILPFGLVAQNQGLTFFEGSWAALTAKAKSENKPIFVDFYTNWCGPCKNMERTFFPDKAAGELMNPNFINYRLDAEAGEGILMAQRYNINSYPTSVFLTAEGVQFHRFSGFGGNQMMMDEANKAVDIFQFSASKTLAELDIDFEKGNRDKRFVVNYFARKLASNQNISSVKDAYFSSLNNTELEKAAVIKLLIDSPIESDTKVLNYFKARIKRDATTLPLETHGAIKNGMSLSIYKAIAAKDYSLIQKINEANDALADLQIQFYKKKGITGSVLDDILERTIREKEDNSISFFTKINDYNSLDTLAVGIYNQLKTTDNELIALDSKFYKSFLEKSSTIPEEQKKAAYFINYAKTQEHYYSDNYAKKIRKIAALYANSSFKSIQIKKAIYWMQSAQKLSNNEENHFVMAQLYKQVGNKKKALKSIQTAIIMDAQNELYQQFYSSMVK